MGVLVLSYFGISLKDVTHSAAAQDNFSFLQGLLVSAWDFIWNFALSTFHFLQGFIPAK